MGLVKSGGNTTISNGLITINDDSHLHTIKNIKNLSQTLLDKASVATTIVDNEVAYQKSVPANVLPNAAVCEIGGMSYKSENLIGQIADSQSMNGITFAKNADGSITVNGTATAQAYNTMTSLADVSNGEYTVSLKGANPDAFIYMSFTDNTGKTIGIGTSYTFTITDAKKIGYIILNVNAERTITNETYYIMLNKGSTTLPYQPYFTGLRDSKVTAVESVGANLIPFPYIETTKTNNGVAFTVNEDGTVTANGTAVNYNATLQLANNVQLPAGTYRVTCTDTPKSGAVFVIRKNGVWHKETNNVIELLVESGDVLGFYLQVVAGLTVSNFTFKPMLNKGETALPYSPYFRDTFPIPEAVQNLDGWGQGVNAQCYNKIVLDPAEGVKKFETNSKRVIFNGTETVLELNENGTYSNRYCIEFSGSMTKNADTILTHYDTDNNWAITDKSYYATPYANGAKIRIVIMDSAISSLADFSAHIAEQYANGTPLTFEYALATPTETDVSAYFTDDNLLPVEAGGEVTAVNEYEQEVPFTIEYYTSDTADKIIGGKKIVGDLMGTAASASTLTQTLSIPKGGTGASDAENARKNLNAAPDGYGLGVKAYNLPSLADANDATDTGWYKIVSSTANAIGAAAMLRVEARENGYIKQTEIRASTGAVRTRDCVGGVWGEWEWINPPMIVGIEYRTTERWNGKAVFAKMVSYTPNGEIGNTGGSTDIQIPHNISRFDSLVRLNATVFNTIPLPVVSADGLTTTAVTQINSSIIELRINKRVWNNAHTFAFELHYTKV